MWYFTQLTEPHPKPGHLTQAKQHQHRRQPVPLTNGLPKVWSEMKTFSL